TRWDLPLPSRAATMDYMNQVQERILEVVQRGPTAEEVYFILLSVSHEDMHGEAFLYTRQTLGYSRPQFRSIDVGERGVPAPRVRVSGSPVAPGAHAPRSPGFPLNGETEGGSEGAGPLPGDVQIPGGTFQLGAGRDEPFVFDNEKWAHPVSL